MNQVCLRAWQETFTRPCNPSWRGHHGLVHARQAAPDRPVSIIRTLEVHPADVIGEFLGER